MNYRELKEIEAETIGNRANELFDSGELAQAVSLFMRAIDICEEISDFENMAYWSGNLGVCFMQLGDFSKAIACFERAIGLAGKFSKDWEEFILNSLGLSYHSVGLHKKAIDTLDRSLKSTLISGNKQNEQQSHGNLGTVFSANGAIHKAQSHYEEALRIAKVLGDTYSESVSQYFSNS